MRASHTRWLSALTLALTGCLVDDNNVCGENQREFTGLSDGCVCVMGTVPNDDGVGCKPCPAGQSAMSGRCVADKPATPDAGGSDAMSMMPARNGTVGQGMTCATSADCASFDATFCETQQSKTCLVRDCATGERVCADDRVCCDFSALASFGPTFAEFAATNGVCVPMGGCAAPGRMVTP
jgi:hypothetical protein